MCLNERGYLYIKFIKPLYVDLLCIRLYVCERAIICVSVARVLVCS